MDDFTSIGNFTSLEKVMQVSNGPGAVSQSEILLDLQQVSINVCTGHYVPQLAKKIHYYNKAHWNSIINLRGFMVGNAVTDNYYDSIGTVTYCWSHSMISDKTYKSIMKDCTFTEEKSSARCDVAAKKTLLHRRVSGYDTCTENYAERYYNWPDVQKAMHANTTGIPYNGLLVFSQVLQFII
ncbi:Serine carboxypeptidase 24 [Hibiscus syriacus]|uniref:Serine carboxypeptidase 24 n=1 Tax=Hibiscus syriacus TaxID=106335 RepID=A0A6A2X1Z3_HIBSY|nr:Serine carboxypeptidase 24 [Hibiscus syriacus]